MTLSLAQLETQVDSAWSSELKALDRLARQPLRFVPDQLPDGFDLVGGWSGYRTSNHLRNVQKPVGAVFYRVLRLQHAPCYPLFAVALSGDGAWFWIHSQLPDLFENKSLGNRSFMNCSIPFEEGWDIAVVDGLASHHSSLYSFHLAYSELPTFVDLSSVGVETLRTTETADYKIKGLNLHSLANRFMLDQLVTYVYNDALRLASIFQNEYSRAFYLLSKPTIISRVADMIIQNTRVPIVSDWQNRYEAIQRKFSLDVRYVVGDIESAVMRLNKPNEWTAHWDWTPMLKYRYKWEQKVQSKSFTIYAWYLPGLCRLRWKGMPIVVVKGVWRAMASDGSLKRLPHWPFSRAAETLWEAGDFTSENQQLTDNVKTHIHRWLWWVSVAERVDQQYVRGTMLFPAVAVNGTSTGRVVEPLLQTLPRPNSVQAGSEVKTWVRAFKGWSLVGADFDCQELRIAALLVKSYCQDLGSNPLQQFVCDCMERQERDDIHMQTAKVFRVSRNVGKTINFALLYGAGKPKLIEILMEHSFSRIDAIELVSELSRNTYCGRVWNRVRRVLNSRWDLGGSVPTLPLLGSPMHPELMTPAGSSKALKGRNWVVQGTAAEMLRIFVVLMELGIRRLQLRAHLIITVHDEVWYHCPDDELDQLVPLLHESYCGTWQLLMDSLSITMPLPESLRQFREIRIEPAWRKDLADVCITPTSDERIREGRSIFAS